MKKVSDRLAGLAATLLLQAVFIALFLQTPHLGTPPQELARELTFILPRLHPVLPPRIAPRAASRPPIEAPQSVVVTPPPPAATLPSAPAIPNTAIQELGQSLFGCAPENLGNLSPEERARCGPGIVAPDGTAMNPPPSHVKDPARRQAELAARNTPGRVPCTEVMVVGPGVVAAGADPVCVINGLLSGFRVTGLPP